MVEISPVVEAVLPLVFIGVYVVISINYFVLHTLALVALYRDSEADDVDPETDARPGVGIVVPAYNEEETILDSLPSFLNLAYPNTEVVVVNDGSTDDTLARLQEAFDLRQLETVPEDVPSRPIRAVYESDTRANLRVVDKEDGGKSDALNAGIWLTDKPYVCAVDSDTIIERGALFDITEPCFDRPREVVAAGGTVRVANGCTFRDGEIVDVDLSTRRVVSLQAMEYLRAFYLGRLGLSRLKSLVLISGAFGVFRTDVLREIGGYRRNTVTEDFDLVVRLHEHLRRTDEQYSVEYVPSAIAWTEVPETLTALGRQRRRWFRGMIETLRTHRGMVGNPRYGVVGIYALPFYVLAEFVGPLLEGLGFVLVPLAYAAGVVDLWFLLAFFLVTSGFGTLLSWYGVLGEALTDGGYTDAADIRRLLVDGVLENVGYRQWKTLVAWYAFVEYLLGGRSWGEMERTGLE